MAEEEGAAGIRSEGWRRRPPRGCEARSGVRVPRGVTLRPPPPPLSEGEAPAPRGRPLPWLLGRVGGGGRELAASESAGAEEAGREERHVLVREPGSGRRGVGMTCRKEDAGISVPAVRNRRLVWVRQVCTLLPRPGACGRGASLGRHRYPGPGVGWHRVPDRRGPRGPLFPLHVARFSCQARGEGGGRREGAAALTCQR